MKHFFFVVAGLGLMSGPAAADTLDSAVGTQTQINRQANESQQRIDKISDQTEDMITEYRLVTRRTDSLRLYNAHLEKIIGSQEEEIVSIGKQIETLETTNREVVPLMIRMIDTLKEFVSLDMPFLVEERAGRIENLAGIMHRADVTTSEKYRRVMEAYQKELDYARTIEAYTSKLNIDGEEREVDFLRVGRLALMYQTQDRKEQGYWDKEARQWVSDPDYGDAVREGLRIAKKQTAPKLMTVPVQAPEAVQ
ncbi:MAG: DUF3450 domain-containing protein [Gammaproteobacteria bacterium]|jgi:hypothetical protein|nr:DUF3450 domain-containing protein [Gammaproteobacteria bacterium]